MMGARHAAEVLATFCCGAFFGAAIYISLAQHPAALETGGEWAVRFFPWMYARAASLQASLAILGTIAASVAYVCGAGRIWLCAALMIFSVVPFTLLVVDPVNQQIRAIDPSSDRAVALLVQWGRLHWIRTVAGGIAFLSCLIGRR